MEKLLLVATDSFSRSNALFYKKAPVIHQGLLYLLYLLTFRINVFNGPNI